MGGEPNDTLARGPSDTQPLDWEQEEERLSSRSYAAGDPTGWFDQLYAAGEAGRSQMPWSRTEPHPLLVEWASLRRLNGRGRRAIVVGCGLGGDAEYVAGLGFATVAFDISATAIRLARERHPATAVRYLTADLLHPPADWLRAFELVVEIITVQALPEPFRGQAIGNVSRLVGSRGTLLAIAAVDDDREPPNPNGPWPLRRAQVEAFTVDGLTPVLVEQVADAPRTNELRWRAEFRRR